MSSRNPTVRRVLFCGLNCYLDDSNGAAVASRAMMEALGRRGFAVEALTGTMFEAGPDVDPADWLAGRGFMLPFDGDPREPGAADVVVYRLEVRGVAVALHRCATTKTHPYNDVEAAGFLALLDEALDRFRPDVLVNYGGDPVSLEVRSRARARGIAVVFPLHNFNYRNAGPFSTADAVTVPSRFAADHHRRSFGLECTVLPNLVDPDRCRAISRDPRFLTYVNPSHEKGVFAFARIADELGKRRPDIPILVVEGRGAERTVADCGLDLLVHGNVNFMAHTSDPREFWGVTKVCLLPSLWWENQPLVAVEAMLNGVPVIGSDRGGIPETLGESGIVLPLPERLTPFSRELPTAEEVAPWVEAIIRLWDDPTSLAEQGLRALAEGRRWDPDVLEPLYAKFFAEVRPKPRPEPPGRPAPAVERPAGRSIEQGIEVIKRRWPGLLDDCDDEPIFVLASGWRSGSTMLQRLVFGPWFVWGEPFGHAGLVESMAAPLRCFTDSWPESHHFHKGEGIESLGREFIANLYPPVQDLREAHRAYFRALFAEPARRAGVSRWGFKEVRLDVDYALYLKWLFPRSKFLFLIRNPYDAWRSYAARAMKGWKWYNRWPDDPVTVRSFAAHWRKLASSFLEGHAKVDGIVVRYESLARGEYDEIETYLGRPLSREAGTVNPRDGGPPPLPEILPADRLVLDEELGALAATLGYLPGGTAPSVLTPEDTPTGVDPGLTISASREVNMDPARCVILVPYGHHIEPACDDALRLLERRGYTVRRVRGYSAIDQGRNQIATNALRDGFEELMWIDSDVSFDSGAVERLRSHGLPITCGVYPKKGPRSFACNFPAETESVVFGDGGGLVEIPYAGAGFLHTRREVYRVIQERLGLPTCNEVFGPSMVPFFQPMVVPDGPGNWYLAEDYSFCRRARDCGYRILADTTFRLRHIGPYAYSWEDAGGERQRYVSFHFRTTR